MLVVGKVNLGLDKMMIIHVLGLKWDLAAAVWII